MEFKKDAHEQWTEIQMDFYLLQFSCHLEGISVGCIRMNDEQQFCYMNS